MHLLKQKITFQIHKIVKVKAINANIIIFLQQVNISFLQMILHVTV